MTQTKRPYFRHFVIEAYIASNKLNSIAWLRDRTEKFLSKLQIVNLKSIEQKFKPSGISLVYILSSSHIAIHTWTENNYFHIDLVTCSKNSQIDKIEEIAKSIFKQKELKITELIY